MCFIDLRDRYGVTQLAFNTNLDDKLFQEAKKINREFVIQILGIVVERTSKNPKISTGDIEINVKSCQILNQSKTPPFTIEDISDGGDELRMKYRYLDIRRSPVKDNLILRHRISAATRGEYLNSNENFIEVETPYLIKSTRRS